MIFITIVSAILAGSSFYLGKKLLRLAPWARQHPHIVTFALAAFVILQLAGPLLYRKFPPRSALPFILQWITYGTLGLFGAILIYVLFADLLTIIGRAFTKSPDLERRAFFAASVAALGSWGIGVAQALATPKIYEVQVRIDNLPPELEGYRIAQITDTHIGPTLRKDFLRMVVERTNSLQADLVVLTGDLIDGTVPDLSPQLTPLRDLHAKDGVFFVTGNHEYYWNGYEWIQEFSRLGLQPLLNQHKVIERGSAKLVLAGVTDHDADLQAALHRAPPDATRVLLMHRPSDYRSAAAAGFHLQLSGHTHGGQFFPWSIFVALAHRYHIGLNRHEKMWIYVSRGTGYWGPPVRFTVPSEISLLELRRA